MKKIFLLILTTFFLFSCSSENFDKNKFQKIENENFSYLIPKDWTFSEWKYSKITEVFLPKEKDFTGNFLVKDISLSSSWSTFEDFHSRHLAKKTLIKNEKIEISGISSERYTYKEAEIIREVVLFVKWDLMFKIELAYLENSENKEKIEEILKSIKIK